MGVGRANNASCQYAEVGCRQMSNIKTVHEQGGGGDHPCRTRNNDPLRGGVSILAAEMDFSSPETNGQPLPPASLHLGLKGSTRFNPRTLFNHSTPSFQTKLFIFQMQTARKAGCVWSGTSSNIHRIYLWGK